MKILSITAQKPNSTGSGVYLTELVKAWDKLGITQAVVAGVCNGEQCDFDCENKESCKCDDKLREKCLRSGDYEKSRFSFAKGVVMYPVCYESKDIGYSVVGMSDTMPYKSTKYSELTDEMVEEFANAFLKVIRRAVEELKPDIIFCHHLYLLTAMVRMEFPDILVYGLCHGTDLRQLQKITLRRWFITKHISRMDKIFVLHKAQYEEVRELFYADDNKIEIIGVGYNDDIFNLSHKKRYIDSLTLKSNEEVGCDDTGLFGNKDIRIIFAGKITEKKGVISLLRSLDYIDEKKYNFELALAGGTGDKKEYEKIISLAKKSKFKIEFLGKLTQVDLANEYGKSDIFVLPSFFEGLPLVVIEALACGLRVVVTDLPGVKEWLETSLKNPPISYVTLPKMIKVDEADALELPAFENELAEKIMVAMDKVKAVGRCGIMSVKGIENVGWTNVAKRVVSGYVNEENKQEMKT